jgi:hypothetical protein
VSTEHTGSDHTNAIEVARLAYVGAIRDSRPDGEITILRAALKDAIRGAGGEPDKHMDEWPFGEADVEPRTLFDVVSKDRMTATLMASIRQTLTTTLMLRGLAFDPATLEEIVRELARNTAQAVLGLEVTE